VHSGTGTGIVWVGPTSFQSGLGTFFVPESGHAKHFHLLINFD